MMGIPLWLTDECSQLDIKVNPEEKEFDVILDAKTVGKVHLIMKQERKDKFIIRLERDGNVLFKFASDKHLGKIGKTSADKTIYEVLKDNFEEHGIVLDFGKKESKENFKVLVKELRLLKGEFEDVLNNNEWNSEEKLEPELKPFKEVEEFNEETIEEAAKLVESGKLIDTILDVAEFKVVKQRGKVGLNTLIAMSTFLEKPTHSIATGVPGIGKSATMDVIFEIFPENRKIEISKSSTEASIMNMTKLKEGKYVLQRRLVRLGDLGTETEMQDKSVQKILGIIRVMMSEGAYSKTLTDLTDDETKATVLKLIGIGSVQLSTVGKVEEQFNSRSIIFTPDNNVEVAKAVREYQIKGVQKMMFKKQFREKRPIIACAIDKIASIMDDLYEEYEGVEFINPFAEELDERLGVTGTKNEYRNREHVIDLVKSVTLCNIKNRDIYELGKEQAAIVVTPGDYIYALSIIGKPMLQMLSKSGSTQQDTYTRFIWDTLGDRKDEFKSKDFYEIMNPEDIQDTIDKCPCFTKKQCLEYLNIADTDANYKSIGNKLEAIINDGVLVKHKFGKNYYFPTDEFEEYMNNLSKNPFEIDDLEKELDKFNKMYEKGIEELGGYGFKKVCPAAGEEPPEKIS